MPNVNDLENIAPRLMNEQSARAYLGGVSRSMIYMLRAQGFIHPVHLGTAVRYSVADLDKAIIRFQAHE